MSDKLACQFASNDVLIVTVELGDRGGARELWLPPDIGFMHAASGVGLPAGHTFRRPAESYL
jgi:hypothetical protein